MEENTKVEAQPKEVDFRQKIENRFQSAFAEAYQRRGQKAGAPHVKVIPFFSPHDTPEDLSGLRGEIREDSLDVYVPEAFGWRQNDLKLFRQVSFGEMPPKALDERLKEYSPGFRKNVKDAYHSHIPIMIIDVPARRSLKKEPDEAWEYKPPLEGDFSEALNYTRTFLDSLAARQNKRENYMLSQITPEKVEELLKTYPGLVGDKKELNILFSLGLGHAPLPYDYPELSLMDQGIVMSRVDKKIDDELAARIFLESFMGKLFSTGFSDVKDRLTSDSRKFSMFKRKLLSEFSHEDAERIFNYCKSREIFPRDEFRRIFTEKNIKIPDNEKELDQFLAKTISKNPRSATF